MAVLLSGVEPHDARQDHQSEDGDTEHHSGPLVTSSGEGRPGLYLGRRAYVAAAGAHFAVAGRYVFPLAAAAVGVCACASGREAAGA